MLKITKTTRKEIHDFNIREWHSVDVEHYGKPVEWNAQKFLYKIEENGEIVGTISGRHESGVIYIDSVIIAHDKRGRGIGSLLMNKAEEFGRKVGAHKLHLTTGKDWLAVKFYQKIGFKKVADLPNHHFKKDFVILEKSID